jgi:hypothetical protein
MKSRTGPGPGLDYGDSGCRSKLCSIKIEVKNGSFSLPFSAIDSVAKRIDVELTKLGTMTIGRRWMRVVSDVGSSRLRH